MKGRSFSKGSGLASTKGDNAIMTKFRINYDTVPFSQKPDNFGAIRNRTCAPNATREVSADQFINLIETGHTFAPACLNGTQHTDWAGQQLICADIDNDETVIDKETGKEKKVCIENPCTPEEAVEILAGYGMEPFCVYKTFHYSNEWPRFRIVMLLDNPVPDQETAAEYSRALNFIFEQFHPNCTDPCNEQENRMFLGSNADCMVSKIKASTPNEMFADLSERHKEAVREQISKEAEQFHQTNRTGQNIPENVSAGKPYDLRNEIRQFNLADYFAGQGMAVKRAGQSVFINPCPICGHRDDFAVKGGLWYCHGQNGRTGGTIIDYLMKAENLSLKEALNRFEYDIMGHPRQEPEPEEPVKICIPCVSEYLRTSFSDDLMKYSQSGTQTGFQTFDEKTGGIFTGLTIIGAGSGAGKTTFCLQIADQIATSGRPVVYVSCEQSAVELVSKSLNRIINQAGRIRSNSKRVRQTFRPGQSVAANMSEYEKAMIEAQNNAYAKYCKEVADNLFILEGSFGLTIEQLIAGYDELAKGMQNAPVLFVDYLQCLKTSERITDQRLITDRVVTGLKLLSRDYSVPVVAISSFNRSAGNSEADMTSFKESGMIEFTSDLLMTLEYSTVRENRETFNRDTGSKKAERKDLLESAQQADQREMNLTLLKNRWDSCYHRTGKKNDDGTDEKRNYFRFYFDPGKDLFTERD